MYTIQFKLHLNVPYHLNVINSGIALAMFLSLKTFFFNLWKCILHIIPKALSLSLIANIISIDNGLQGKHNSANTVDKNALTL